MPTAEFGADRTSPRRARAFVSETLQSAGVGGDAAEIAILLVSELVTNAVLHARTHCTVEVEVDGHKLVRVAVHDGSSTTPHLRAPERDAATGRGLLYVDRLASSWGSTPTSDGKVVWFEVEPTATFGGARA